MPYAEANGARLYFEEAGRGYPIVFVHEFAGDHRSWAPQLAYFSRRYRCVAYNARGYPPSAVPDDAAHYGQDIATDDVIAVMDHLELERAHIVGLSMGGFAALHVGLRYAERASALVVAGCGYGAPPDQQTAFKAECDLLAARFEREGTPAVARLYAAGPARVQFQNKDPQGWAEFRRHFLQHSAAGAAHTLRGVQGRRPSLYELAEGLAALETPLLLIAGDEDEPCLDANIYLKRTVPSAGLVVLPRTGHTINLEEPARFNEACAEFFATVERGRWGQRDARTISDSILIARP